MHKVPACKAIPRLLNIYLCFHGLAYPVKFKLKCKNLIFFAAATLFTITNEMNKLYSILTRFTSFENRRNNNVLTLIMILECLLRIQFFLKRKHLKYLNHHMAKIYSTIIPYTIQKYRNVLIIVLIINDICTLAKIFSWYLTLEPFTVFSYPGDTFSYGYVNGPASRPLYFFSVFLESWCFVTPYIPVYFCCFCLALKQMINGLKKRLEKRPTLNFKSVDQICIEISNLTSDFNEALHYILLLAFVILLGRVFYHTYTMLVDKQASEYLLLYRILNIIICFIRFLVICIFASSTSKAGSELKRSIYDVEVQNSSDRWKYCRLINKINDKFVEFKLLDSLVLDKNLILAAVGSLVTYGIIIATFNINSKM